MSSAQLIHLEQRMTKLEKYVLTLASDEEFQSFKTFVRKELQKIYSILKQHETQINDLYALVAALTTRVAALERIVALIKQWYEAMEAAGYTLEHLQLNGQYLRNLNYYNAVFKQVSAHTLDTPTTPPFTSVISALGRENMALYNQMLTNPVSLSEMPNRLSLLSLPTQIGDHQFSGPGTASVKVTGVDTEIILYDHHFKVPHLTIDGSSVPNSDVVLVSSPKSTTLYFISLEKGYNPKVATLSSTPFPTDDPEIPDQLGQHFAIVNEKHATDVAPAFAWAVAVDNVLRVLEQDLRTMVDKMSTSGLQASGSVAGSMAISMVTALGKTTPQMVTGTLTFTKTQYAITELLPAAFVKTNSSTPNVLGALGFPAPFLDPPGIPWYRQRDDPVSNPSYAPVGVGVRGADGYLYEPSLYIFASNALLTPSASIDTYEIKSRTLPNDTPQTVTLKSGDRVVELPLHIAIQVLDVDLATLAATDAVFGVNYRGEACPVYNAADGASPSFVTISNGRLAGGAFDHGTPSLRVSDPMIGLLLPANSYPPAKNFPSPSDGTVEAATELKFAVNASRTTSVSATFQISVMITDLNAAFSRPFTVSGMKVSFANSTFDLPPLNFFTSQFQVGGATSSGYAAVATVSQVLSWTHDVQLSPSFAYGGPSKSTVDVFMPTRDHTIQIEDRGCSTATYVAGSPRADGLDWTAAAWIAMTSEAKGSWFIPFNTASPPSGHKPTPFACGLSWRGGNEVTYYGENGEHTIYPLWPAFSEAEKNGCRARGAVCSTSQTFGHTEKGLRPQALSVLPVTGGGPWPNVSGGPSYLPSAELHVPVDWPTTAPTLTPAPGGGDAGQRIYRWAHGQGSYQFTTWRFFSHADSWYSVTHHLNPTFPSGASTGLGHVSLSVPPIKMEFLKLPDELVGIEDVHLVFSEAGTVLRMLVQSSLDFANRLQTVEATTDYLKDSIKALRHAFSDLVAKLQGPKKGLWHQFVSMAESGLSAVCPIAGICLGIASGIMDTARAIADKDFELMIHDVSAILTIANNHPNLWVARQNEFLPPSDKTSVHDRPTLSSHLKARLAGLRGFHSSVPSSNPAVVHPPHGSVTNTRYITDTKSVEEVSWHTASILIPRAKLTPAASKVIAVSKVSLTLPQNTNEKVRMPDPELRFAIQQYKKPYSWAGWTEESVDEWVKCSKAERTAALRITHVTNADCFRSAPACVPSATSLLLRQSTVTPASSTTIKGGNTEVHHKTPTAASLLHIDGEAEEGESSLDALQYAEESFFLPFLVMGLT